MPVDIKPQEAPGAASTNDDVHEEAAPAAKNDPGTEDEEDEDDGEDGEDEEEDDDEEEEPKLKYTRLTGHLGPIYRNGDSTSAFMVAGDKMVVGTHDGRIHVVSVPTFQSIALYNPHSASVTSISVSPFPPPLPAISYITPSQSITQASSASVHSTTGSGAPTSSPRPPNRVNIPATPSNSLYIATSSIDGHVFVSSLVDSKDMTLRNFARPVQAVALSPDYKNDRSYISGGLAGNLILTTGGRAGVSSNANTSSAAAAASSWLGSIGLGSNSGKDTILHSNEGAISIIKWSLTGKFVMWANEQGIRIMRTNIKLENADSESAWKLMGIVERPNRTVWEEMSGVWKARAEWIDSDKLEVDEDDVPSSNGSHKLTNQLSENPSTSAHSTKSSHKRKKQVEKLVVGWGDCAWVIHVNPGGTGTGKNAGEKIVGTVDIVHFLRFEDCVVSGLSLYTPSLLLVLAYRTRDDNDDPITPTIEKSPKRGIHHRQNGLSPELKLIEASTGDEVEVDELTISRFESLSASDYHISTVYVPHPQAPAPVHQKGALDAIGGIWEAGLAAKNLFSSGASIISLPNSGDNVRTTPSQSSTSGQLPTPGKKLGLLSAAVSPGLKVFIHSPYDCVLAVKRDLGDHLAWLLEHEEYKDAWELVDDHPEVVSLASAERLSDPTPTATPLKKQQSLVDFFADETDSQTTISAGRLHNSVVEKEKRRIGDLWVQQLVNAGDWVGAGQALGRTLSNSPRFEHWFWIFAQARRFDEITPFIPTKQLQPALSSALYERVIGHYLYIDRLRMRELLDQWTTDLFIMDHVIEPINKMLSSGDVTENTVEGGEKGRDWRVLQDALAKLYVANGQLRDALGCYIRLQNAEAAMKLIRDHHLIEAIRDDVPGFILLRVSKEQMESASLAELEEASSEAVHILVDEARSGVVKATDVVSQLQRQDISFQPFLFFYLRALWQGHGTEQKVGHSADQITSEGRAIAEDFGDLAVELFASYDRPLLMSFIRTSQRYRLEKAAAICEEREYIPELVYLLSKTGETKKALFLIIDKLADVSQAISFAKEQDDPDLWNDLLDYSMDKPRFIRGLLEEVGTAIDPITLVRRIPEGLEIEGLREGIGRMVREYEIQFSISEGVAKVLRGEVAAGMNTLRAGQKRAVKFEVFVKPEAVDAAPNDTPADEVADKPSTNKEDGKDSPKSGHCVGCRKLFEEDEKETLVGFACTHVCHLSCLLSSSNNTSASAAAALQARLASDATDDLMSYTSRSVGAKVAHAHLIRSAVKAGCPYCTGRLGTCTDN